MSKHKYKRRAPWDITDNYKNNRYIIQSNMALWALDFNIHLDTPKELDLTMHEKPITIYIYRLDSSGFPEYWSNPTILISNLEQFMENYLSDDARDGDIFWATFANGIIHKRWQVQNIKKMHVV